jgi:hypothetical protein
MGLRYLFSNSSTTAKARLRAQSWGDDLAQTRTMQIASGTIDITPERLLPVAGHGVQSAGSIKGIHSALEADAVLFLDVQRAVFLIVLDSLFPGVDLQGYLTAQVAPCFAHRTVEVIVTATHTHFAPSIDQTKPDLGAVDPEYFMAVRTQIAKMLVRLAAAPPAEAQYRFAAQPVEGSINRRKRVFRPIFQSRRVGFGHVLMAPNRGGKRADTGRLLLLETPRGQPLAVILGWACHPTAFPRRDLISSEYIGVIRDCLRARLGPIPILFIQGFAGNIRPDLQGRHTPGSMLRAIIGGARFLPVTEAVWKAWADLVATRFEALLDRAQSAANRALGRSPHLEFGKLSISLEAFIDPAPADRQLYFALLGLSEEIRLVFVSAEPTIELEQVFHEIVSGAWLAGYAQDVFGYLTTDQQFREGGYESDYFRKAFGLKGTLRGRNEPMIRDALVGLLRAATVLSAAR